MTHPAAWTEELRLRMKRYFVIKTVGITAFTWLFFIGYFYILRHPGYEATMMPLTALDHLIPLQPPFLIAYFSLWVYIGFAPALQLTFTELIAYGAWITTMCLVGLAIFYFWPTSVPPRAPNASSFPGFAILQGVDAPGNACPSMHVAAAIFSAIWIEHLLRSMGAPRSLRAINGLWFTAIAYSTLAVKQHVVLDVLAGAVMGVAFALPSLRWRPGRARGAADIIGTR
ncbi:MAG TPA: phosphatase PAP2 family protein [Rhizobacter sp.]|nr:phosphatase PAP2 family protein [Rhizobacter sp.]